MSNLIKKIKQLNPEVVIGITALIFYVLIFVFSRLKFPNDDQFILYRYIDNIVSGNGFVYNVGDRVLGATTPLFTLVCAFMKYLLPSVSTPSVVSLVNIVLLALSSALFFRVSKVFLGSKLSAFASLIFILNLSRTIPEGMETPLFLFTTFAFLNCLFDKRFLASSVFLSLAVLTRPDASIIALLAFIYWISEMPLKKAMRLTLISIAIALPWLVFATIYFGSFMPQSLATKLHSHDIYHLASLQGLKVQVAHISKIYWGKIFDPDNIFLQILVNLLPILTLIALGVRRMLDKKGLIVVAIPVFYLMSFSLSNPIIFPWYLSQMEPFWILISIVGLGAVYNQINKKLFIALALLLLIGPVYYFTNALVSGYEGSKVAAFKVGEFIKSEMNQGDSVGLADIGIVGYVSGAQVVDFIGLVSSDSVYYYPVSDACVNKSELYVIPPRLVFDKRPDWIVAGINTMEDCFLSSKWFKDNYRLAKVISGAYIWKLNK